MKKYSKKNLIWAIIRRETMKKVLETQKLKQRTFLDELGIVRRILIRNQMKIQVGRIKMTK